MKSGLCSALRTGDLYGALPHAPVSICEALPRAPLRVLFGEKHPETPKNSIRAGQIENGNYNNKLLRRGAA